LINLDQCPTSELNRREGHWIKELRYLLPLKGGLRIFKRKGSRVLKGGITIFKGMVHDFKREGSRFSKIG